MTNAVSCSNCALYLTAQVLGLETPDCSKLDDVVIRDHPVAKGEVLYSAGEPFRHLYLIHSGACVSIGKLARGSEQVMSYYLPGEIAGIESIGRIQHTHSTKMLERGSICQLDYVGLEKKVTKDELLNIYSYLLRAAASHAAQLQWERSLTGLQTAEQQVAAFLLNISTRLRDRGMPHETFRLPMSRESIADYLGLATETVIRTLRKLQSLQLIQVKTKQISVLKPIELSQYIKG